MPAKATTKSSATGRSAGSQSALKLANRQRVIDLLIEKGPTTQARLVRHTGLSNGTISNIVKELLAEERIATHPIIDSGRRAIEISLTSSGECVLGVEIERTSVQVAAATLDHSVIGSASLTVPPHHSPHSVMQAVAKLSRDLLDQYDIAATSVRQCMLGIATPLRKHTVIGADPSMNQWENIDVLSLAKEILPFDLGVENDANLAALAQLSFGAYGGVKDLCYVKIGTSIAAGLILNGDLYSGPTGTAGQLAHFPVNDSNRACYCGNRGCLATVASSSAIADACRSSFRKRLSEDAIIDLARQHDPAVLRALESAGVSLGKGLGCLINLLNPTIVIIGGSLASIGSPFLEPISRGVRRHTAPPFVAATSLTVSHLGARSTVLGALAAGIRKVVSLPSP